MFPYTPLRPIQHLSIKPRTINIWTHKHFKNATSRITLPPPEIRKSHKSAILRQPHTRITSNLPKPRRQQKLQPPDGRITIQKLPPTRRQQQLYNLLIVAFTRKGSLYETAHNGLPFCHSSLFFAL